MKRLRKSLIHVLIAILVLGTIPSVSFAAGYEAKVILNQSEGGTISFYGDFTDTITSRNMRSDLGSVLMIPEEGYVLLNLTCQQGNVLRISNYTKLENGGVTASVRSNYSNQNQLRKNPEACLSAQFVKSHRVQFEQNEYGTITTPGSSLGNSLDAAAEGETLQITFTPDEGYGVDTLYCIRPDGTKVYYSEEDRSIFTTTITNNAVQFKVPDYDVTIGATFKEINTILSIEQDDGVSNIVARNFQLEAVSNYVRPGDEIAEGTELIVQVSSVTGFKTDRLEIKGQSGVTYPVTEISNTAENGVWRANYSFVMPSESVRIQPFSQKLEERTVTVIPSGLSGDSDVRLQFQTASLSNQESDAFVATEGASIRITLAYGEEASQVTLKANGLYYLDGSGNQTVIEPTVNAGQFLFYMPDSDIELHADFVPTSREIRNYQDLKELSDDVNTRNNSDAVWNVRLMDDILINSWDWQPIGNNTNSREPFAGMFDGNGKTITFDIRSSTGPNFALIGYVEKDLTVRDLTIEGTIVNTDFNNTAGILALSSNIMGANGKILLENCINRANITGQSVAGLVGNYTTAGNGGGSLTLVNCRNEGVIIATKSYAGGLINNIRPLSVVSLQNCSNTGTVAGTSCENGSDSQLSDSGLIGNGFSVVSGYSGFTTENTENHGTVIVYDTVQDDESLTDTHRSTNMIYLGDADFDPEASNQAVMVSGEKDFDNSSLLLLPEVLNKLEGQSLQIITRNGEIRLSEESVDELRRISRDKQEEEASNLCSVSISKLNPTDETVPDTLSKTEGVSIYRFGVASGEDTVSDTEQAILFRLPVVTGEEGTVTVKAIAADGTEENVESTFSEDYVTISVHDFSKLYTVEFSEPEAPVDPRFTETEWDGKAIDVSWFDKDTYSTTDVYTIHSAAQLAGLAAIVNGIYNSDIDVSDIHGDASSIVDHVGDGADSGEQGQNQSTNTYHYGAYDFSGKTILLTEDLDMSAGNYMPVGGQYLMKKNNANTKIGSSFCGTFDGGGHNVTIECDRHCSNGNFGDGSSVGLIGRLGVHDNDPVDIRPVNPTVKNVAVYGNVYANRSVGGVVGKIGKTSFNNEDGSTGGIIENCANFATIKNTDAKGVGGIVGAGWNGGIIRNCYNAGNITSTYNCPAGGISGSNEVILENCYNYGKVTALSRKFAMAIGTNNGGAPYEGASASVFNCWYLDGSAPGGGYYSQSKTYNDHAMSSEAMKTSDFIETLGDAFAADDRDVNNGYPVLKWQSGQTEEQTKKPAFASHSLVLSGQIGVNFYMDLPELDDIDYTNSYMEFTVNGETWKVDYDVKNQNGSGKSGFTCYVNSIQMADAITAVFHYGENLTVEDAEPYSVSKYVDAFHEAADSFDEKTRTLVDALADYGHYIQPFLAETRGWKIGEAHQEMPGVNSYADKDVQEAADAVENFGVLRETGESGIEKVTFSLYLDTDTSMYFYLKPKADFSGEVTAQIGGAGENAAEKLSDGRYRVVVPGISAHLLGTDYRVDVSADSAFAIQASAMSYVNAMLHATAYQDNQAAQYAMTALYNYYQAAAAYTNR